MAVEISKITDRTIQKIYRSGNPDKAVLSSLRSTMSLSSPRAQKAWPVLIGNLDETMLSRNGKPTYAEVAIFSALHFYAIHQASEPSCVYERYDKDDDTNKSLYLFNALGVLRQNESIRDALDRRVQALLATTNVDSMIHSISHLVGILKSNQKAQKVDYAQLAQDIFWFQISYEQANRVRLKWGQQYFWAKTKTAENEGK